ncbi:hypothetical protein N657DRAFT_634902 [Parathielavia appendiculata]|uniref:Uncharacterized protein n=1 Tax=Parathielavia appendiculata TaxID=2587402 RepID=A0AAN6Z3Q3_9PEZI|nr:hypothetical protein N657DRAFT_634902 [Parathielavia appendiculata]
MVKKPVICPSLLLISLICSSCAWVGEGLADGPFPVTVRGREAVDEAGGAEPLWGRVAGRVEGRREGPYPGLPLAAEPAHVIRDGRPATITPPPTLLNRQDQGQIQALSDQLRQLSEQSRSVSQSSQQLSQLLQQATQRLSQTEQQLASARLQQSAAESASRSMLQASAEASRRADEARAGADQAISEAIRSASQSANRAMSENMASVTSSMGASFSSALLLASQSAASAASAAQKAQADATALSNNASEQIQQAQGDALSVAQTAIAVVGGIVGSSLLTGVGFMLVLRHRRKKKRRHGEGIIGSIGYQQSTGTSNKAYSISHSKNGYVTSDDGSSTYSTDDTGFKFPPSSNTGNLRQPAPAVTTDGIPRKGIDPSGGDSGSGGVGYAVSYYGPRPSATNTSGKTIFSTNETSHQRPRQFQLGNPPAPRGAAAAAAGRGKFTLFPRPKATNQTNGAISRSGQGEEEDDAEEKVRHHHQQATSARPPPLSSSAGGAGVGLPGSGWERDVEEDEQQHQQGVQAQGQGERRMGLSSGAGLPSLDRWLREGTDVSPFSTLKGVR